MTKEQRQESYEKGVLHRNRRLLGETKMTFTPFNKKHSMAQILLLECVSLFNEVCREYPLKKAKIGKSVT